MLRLMVVMRTGFLPLVVLITLTGCSTGGHPVALPSPSGVQSGSDGVRHSTVSDSKIQQGPGNPYPAASIGIPDGATQPIRDVVIGARVQTSKGQRALAAYTDGRGLACVTPVEMKGGSGSTSCLLPGQRSPGLGVGFLGGGSASDVDPDLLFGEAPARTAILNVTVEESERTLPLYRVRVNGIDRLFFLVEQPFGSGRVVARALDESGRVIARYPSG